MSKPAKPDAGNSTILVTGDVVVDHHIYAGEQRTAADAGTSKRKTFEHVEFGGAALIERLLTPAADEKITVPWLAVLGPVKDATLYPHCYATWTPRPSPHKGETATWRVESALGYGSSMSPWPADDRLSRPPDAAPGSRPPQLEPSIPSEPDLLVIDDAGLGFRDRAACWPDCLSSSKRAPQWVLWKISGNLGGGALWTQVKAAAGVRFPLIVLVSAADLRRAGYPISRGYSWERTTLDTARALKFITVGPLAKCQHVIVSFESAGALWADRPPKGKLRYKLVFDPSSIEADPAEPAHGKVFGFQACLVAGIAWGLAVASTETTSANDAERDALLDGVRRGLNARRVLYTNGHGPTDAGPPAGFPARRIREHAFRDPPQSFTQVDVQDDIDPEHWTILRDSARASGVSGPLYAEARLVALNGLSALGGMPSLQVGGYATVDRREIESLRRIHHLVRHYESRTPQRQPLSLAIFGAPGAGKSFIAKQIAKWVLGDDPPYLEINLSQFYDEKELIGAFHRVRDLVLKGRTPLVLWDEFDAQEYRWLRLLLAPMQDGTFQEGQIVHPVGKCVFVFAGGTSETFDAFESRAVDGSPEVARDVRVWKFAKGPDFVSRLHGSLDVLGPNQRLLDPVKHGTERKPDETDVCFPIRRAFFLRGVLGVRDPARLPIDPELLDALLRMPSYRHGSRSFERILNRLREGGKPFTQAALPAREDLTNDIAGECARPGHDGEGV